MKDSKKINDAQAKLHTSLSSGIMKLIQINLKANNGKIIKAARLDELRALSHLTNDNISDKDEINQLIGLIRDKMECAIFAIDAEPEDIPLKIRALIGCSVWIDKLVETIEKSK